MFARSLWRAIRSSLPRAGINDRKHGIISNEGCCAIAEAMKKNTAIERVSIAINSERALSVPAALSLAGASPCLARPKLKELCFSCVDFADSFSPITLVTCQNEQLNQLELHECSMTSSLMKSARLLAREGERSLEALEIELCDEAGDQLVDFSGALAHNQSLRKLDVNNGSNDALFESGALEEVAQASTESERKLSASLSLAPPRRVRLRHDVKSN